MNKTKYSKEYIEIAVELCKVSDQLLKMAAVNLELAGIATKEQLMSSDVSVSQVVALASLMEELS